MGLGFWAAWTPSPDPVHPPARGPGDRRAGRRQEGLRCPPPRPRECRGPGLSVSLTPQFWWPDLLWLAGPEAPSQSARGG